MKTLIECRDKTVVVVFGDTIAKINYFSSYCLSQAVGENCSRIFFFMVDATFCPVVEKTGSLFLLVDGSWFEKDRAFERWLGNSLYFCREEFLWKKENFWLFKFQISIERATWAIPS